MTTERGLFLLWRIFDFLVKASLSFSSLSYFFPGGGKRERERVRPRKGTRNKEIKRKGKRKGSEASKSARESTIFA